MTVEAASVVLDGVVVLAVAVVKLAAASVQGETMDNRPALPANYTGL